MAEENHPSQNEPETVPLADHIALRREIGNLQVMVQQLLIQDHPNTGLVTPQHSIQAGASVTPRLPSIQPNVSQSIPQPFPEVGETIIQNPPPIQTHTGAVPLPVIPNSPRGIDPIINQKIKHLEEALKAMQGPNAYPSTKFSDLCFFPNQPLPAKFKIPDFTKFNGTTNPMTISDYLHRIQTWAELSQEFVKQYRHNADIGIDRMHLLRMEQEPEETFRAYALRWKNSASQVEPPLLDYEYGHLFVQTLDGVYYEKLCTSIGRSFSEIIQQGEMIEEGIKTGKIIDPYATW
ncbi:hypothetical protein Vadar_003963 [Vaccinium darrowii]|uniref:Uncharacterized protein n=1 Tax=Vaccinium darrowii TaxID=229202 RepID=A0ACB7XND6_9ERIC|nr:hypothetical protein Vadar_003963 [Vaccinium darrowii]